jgi:hypothetical protein
MSLTRLIHPFPHFYTLHSRVISHYVIEQSMISIFDMKKISGSEAKQNPRDSIDFNVHQFNWYLPPTDTHCTSSSLTLNQTSGLVFFNLYMTCSIYFWKIKFKFSFEIEVKSRGFLLAVHPSIIKLSGVLISLKRIIFIYYWTCSRTKYSWNTARWTLSNNRSINQ